MAIVVTCTDRILMGEDSSEAPTMWEHLDFLVPWVALQSEWKNVFFSTWELNKFATEKSRYLWKQS
jgi:hypothetical protein